MRSVAIVTGPDHGHALNAIALAGELASRGVDVTVATGTPHARAVEAAGARFIELPLLSPTPGDADIAHLLVRRPAEMGPPLADRLRPHAPEVVVADVITVAGAFAAELLGVPWIELSPHMLYEPDPWVPPVGLGRLPSRTPWRRRSDDRIRRAQARSEQDGRDTRDRTRRELGLTGDGRPVLRLAAVAPGLEHPRLRWPADAFVVGPFDAEPDLEPLVIDDDPRPLVVVTDTTATGVAGSLAGTALRALRHTGVRLVVTSGRRDLDPWPGATVAKAPHGPLLDHATAAIGPGGAGFVGKAARRGVPLVVVPLAGDQREMAARVRASGAGLRIRPALATATAMRLAVTRLLTDPRFQAAADDLAASTRGLGVGVAATLVEEVLAGRRPVADGPYAARRFS